MFKGIYCFNLLISSDFRKHKINFKNSLQGFVKRDYCFDKRLLTVTISIEDKRFYHHYGHDILSICRAFLNNITNKRIQGASTIEQQIVRTLLGKTELTYKRKLLEIILSTELTDSFSKEEIINLYLCCYVFSKNLIGVKALCENDNYNIENLSNKEICEIVARFKYPNITKANYIKFLKRVRAIDKINNHDQHILS